MHNSQTIDFQSKCYFTNQCFQEKKLASSKAFKSARYFCKNFVFGKIWAWCIFGALRIDPLCFIVGLKCDYFNGTWWKLLQNDLCGMIKVLKTQRLLK